VGKGERSDQEGCLFGCDFDAGRFAAARGLAALPAEVVGLQRPQLLLQFLLLPLQFSHDIFKIQAGTWLGRARLGKLLAKELVLSILHGFVLLFFLEFAFSQQEIRPFLAVLSLGKRRRLLLLDLID
jgi:hypothetical protein